MKHYPITLFCFMILTIGLTFSKESFELYYGSAGIDYAYCIQQTNDGGYIVTGKSESGSVGGENIFLMKLDEKGNKTWYKTFGGSGDEWGKDVQQTSDGGYIITGWTDTDQNNGYYRLWLIKTDSEGNEEWSKIKKSTYTSDGLGVKETPDGGFIVCGEVLKAVAGNGVFDGWIIKTDKYGDNEWEKKIGGNKRDVLFNVQLTPDGGYIFLGYTYSYSHDAKRDYWLIKTDSLGNVEWDKTYDGINGDDWGRRVRVTEDGGYIFTGASSNSVDFFQMMLIKTDDKGKEVWRKNFGGSKSAQGRGLDLTDDGGYIISGSIEPKNDGYGNGWLVKTDSYGNELWNSQFGKSDEDVDLEYVKQTKDGGYISAGRAYSTETQSSIIVVKTDANGVVGIEDEVNNPDLPKSFELYQNYPNPFNPSTIIKFKLSQIENIKLEVSDVSGRKIKTLIDKELQPGVYEVNWDGTNNYGDKVSSGIYFGQLKNSKFRKVIKLNLMK